MNEIKISMYSIQLLNIIVILHIIMFMLIAYFVMIPL